MSSILINYIVLFTNIVRYELRGTAMHLRILAISVRELCLPDMGIVVCAMPFYSCSATPKMAERERNCAATRQRRPETMRNGMHVKYESFCAWIYIIFWLLYHSGNIISFTWSENQSERLCTLHNNCVFFFHSFIIIYIILFWGVSGGSAMVRYAEQAAALS